MESLPLRLTVNTSIALYKIVSGLLFENPETEDRKERQLPFSIKAKLQQIGVTLEKDYVYYENERERLVKEFGEENGTKVTVPEDKLAEFREELSKVLKTEVTHYNLPKLKMSDVDALDADNFSLGEVELFIAALIDPESIKDEPPETVEDAEKTEEEAK